MAFSVSPNPTQAEKPMVEMPPMQAPETTGAVEVEVPALPETQELKGEEQRAVDTQAVESLRSEIAQPVASTPVAAPPLDKSELEKKIDSILEADLKSVYMQLPENVRPEFKKRGEEAASKIKLLVESAKATAIKIAEILRNWLKLIPASGMYFVEQVVKIKTDQLMALAKAAKIML